MHQFERAISGETDDQKKASSRSKEEVIDSVSKTHSILYSGKLIFLERKVEYVAPKDLAQHLVPLSMLLT